ncbi:MAG: Mur ligase family protein, partial [Bacteroidota bacterium]
NPELLRAQELAIPIYSFPEFLYEQSKHKTRVVIGGSHGKTTITSMILHVLRYHNIEVDYMVGAKLAGFDRMVHLTDDNDFIVLEGDEYLSSPLDPRPKFHLYKANIALLSGIAWDHINVFPTFSDYTKQFSIFVDGIVNGGSITYNEEDTEVLKIIQASENTIRRFPYSTPEYTVLKGVTYLDTEDGPMPLEVFGRHNLSNMMGAKWICQQMGVDEVDFLEAIATFKGADKRLEKLAEKEDRVLFKDFAHSPSKVNATVSAVKEQYPDYRLLACLELHTYSSLNTGFLKEYEGSLNAADEALVFYEPEAVKLKKLEEIDHTFITGAFQHNAINIFTQPEQLQDFLWYQDFKNTALLLMSSGNYGGLELAELVKKFL